MQYLTFKLHFLKVIVIYLANTFETMDDLTYLAMNCFKKINNEYENILIITSFTFTCLLLFAFQE
jgi:hypothetical protein